MILALSILIGLVLAGVAAAAIRGTTRAFALRIGATLLVLATLTVVLALTWKHLVVAIAMAALVLLGLTVMSGKMAPGQAIGASLGALVILFGATWLALQLGDIVFFQRETTLSLWIQDARQWLAGFIRSLRIEDPASSLVFLCIAIFGGALALRAFFRNQSNKP